MGCATSTSPRYGGTYEDMVASRQIDALLRRDRLSQSKAGKKQLLLLGAGDTGKSTICKQVRMLSSTRDYSPKELFSFKSQVYENLLRTVVILSKALAQKGVELTDCESREVVRVFSSKSISTPRSRSDFAVDREAEPRENNGEEEQGDERRKEEEEQHQRLLLKAMAASSSFTSTPAVVLKKFWDEPQTQEEVANNIKNGSLPENVGHFFESLPRVLHTAYVPTFDDILRLRSCTSGIVEIDFRMSEVEFTLVDISGLRTERRKWIHCFDNVTAVIFCASLADYDMTRLPEDEDEEGDGEEEERKVQRPAGATAVEGALNRLEESLALFERTINAGWWSNNSTNFLLFLNKSDLFEKKLLKTPLSSCFKDYEDEPSYDAGVRFIETKFMERNKSGRPVYTHVTCAINTENTKFVFGAVRDTVLSISAY